MKNTAIPGEIKLYFKYVRLHLLSGFQYKGWPMQFLNTLFNVITDPLGLIILYLRFGDMGEWTGARILLIYSLALTGFGLSEVFSRGFDLFPWHVRTGSFDRVLLRPRSTFVQVITLQFHLNRVSRVVGGFAMIFYSFYLMKIAITPWIVAALIVTLAGGTLLYTGIFMIFSAIAFFTLKPMDFIYIFTNGSYQLAKLPPHMLPGWIRHVFTFIVPMFAVSYYPASAICGWGAPAAMAFIALPAGIAFFAASCVIFHFGVRHYTSAGS